jgi:hypothetical protein
MQISTRIGNIRAELPKGQKADAAQAQIDKAEPQ